MHIVYHNRQNNIKKMHIKKIDENRTDERTQFEVVWSTKLRDPQPPHHHHSNRGYKNSTQLADNVALNTKRNQPSMSIELVSEHMEGMIMPVSLWALSCVLYVSAHRLASSRCLYEHT